MAKLNYMEYKNKWVISTHNSEFISHIIYFFLKNFEM